MNPGVLHSSLDEDLDVMLSGKPRSFKSFDVHAVDARSFRVDCQVIACQTGGWVYKGSTVVIEVPVHVGNKTPQVVYAIDAVVGELEKDKRDGIGEMEEIVVRGLSIDGEEERLSCCKG